MVNVNYDIMMYRGWSICHYEDDFESCYEITDNNGWKRVGDYPTLRRAKNAIDRQVDGVVRNRRFERTASGMLTFI